MWYINYFVFVTLAVLFLLLAIYKENNPFLNIVGSLLSCVTWLILTLSQLEIEIPYTAIRSNDTIVTGIHSYTSPISPFLVYFFLLMFIVTFLYFLAMIWDKWYNYKNWHGGF